MQRKTPSCCLVCLFIHIIILFCNPFVPVCSLSGWLIIYVNCLCLALNRFLHGFSSNLWWLEKDYKSISYKCHSQRIIFSRRKSEHNKNIYIHYSNVHDLLRFCFPHDFSSPVTFEIPYISRFSRNSDSLYWTMMPSCDVYILYCSYIFSLYVF